MGDKKDFIIIDDSKLDCFIAEKMIENTGKARNIRSFTEAREAFEYIRSTASEEPQEVKCVIIIDIQMPLMNGFEFLDEFEKLPSAAQENYIIFVLSSSANKKDFARISNYKSVAHLLNKPIKSQTLLDMLK